MKRKIHFITTQNTPLTQKKKEKDIRKLIFKVYANIVKMLKNAATH